MKIWFLRVTAFFLTLLLGVVIIVWLNHFANTSWRTILYDFNLLASCPRDPHLGISCTLNPIVNYVLAVVVLILSIINSFLLVRKKKIYYIPIAVIFIIIVFIIGREIVEDLVSSSGPNPIEVQIDKLTR